MNRINTILAAAGATLTLALPAVAASPKDDDRDDMKGSMTVIGKVIDARDVQLKGVAGNGHRLLKIKNREGKKMVVDVGASGSLDKIDISQGDFIIATGRSARIGGKPVLYAKYVGELQAAGRSGELMFESERSNERGRRKNR